MAVILSLSTGEKVYLDRNLALEDVARQVDVARGLGRLASFANDAIPSRTTYVDPDAVVRIYLETRGGR